MSSGVEPSTDLFRKFEVFDGLTSDDLMAVSECADVQTFQAGDIVLEEDTRSRELYGLIEGRVEVLKTTADGQTTLTELEPSAAFGELGLAVGAPRTATVRAMEASTFLHVDGDAFHELQTSQHPAAYKVEHNILRILARRLGDANQEMLGED